MRVPEAIVHTTCRRGRVGDVFPSRCSPGECPASRVAALPTAHGRRWGKRKPGFQTSCTDLATRGCAWRCSRGDQPTGLGDLPSTAFRGVSLRSSLDSNSDHYAYLGRQQNGSVSLTLAYT